MSIDYEDDNNNNVSSIVSLESNPASSSTSTSSSSSSSSLPTTTTTPIAESNNNITDEDDDHDRGIVVLERRGDDDDDVVHDEKTISDKQPAFHDDTNDKNINDVGVVVLNTDDDYDDDEINSKIMRRQPPQQQQYFEIDIEQQQQQQEEYFEDDYDHKQDDHHSNIHTPNDTTNLHHHHHDIYKNHHLHHPQNELSSSSRSRRRRRRKRNTINTITTNTSSSIRKGGHNNNSSRHNINNNNNNNYSCIHHTSKTIASVTGNILEWYDFSILGFFSDILGMQFFPSTTTTSATTNQQQQQYTNTGGHSLHNLHVHHFEQQQLNKMEAYAIFGIAFLMRPIGGMIVGYIGDVYGRKFSLELSIFAISITTTLMGCLPTYQQIGPGSILLLLMVRMVQGLCVGGQLMSSLVYTLESNPRRSWGLYGSTVMSASPFGFLLGGIMSYILRTNLSQQQLIQWGWRIPFLLGIFISFCGLYLKYCCPQQYDEIYVTKQQQQQHIPQPIPQMDNHDDDDDDKDDDDGGGTLAARDLGGLHDDDINVDHTMIEIEFGSSSSMKTKKEYNIVNTDVDSSTQGSSSCINGQRQILQRRRPRISNGQDIERRRQQQQRRKRKQYRGSRLRTHDESDDDDHNVDEIEGDDDGGGDDDNITTATTNRRRRNPLRLAFARENRRALFGAAFVPVMWSGGFYLCFVWLPMYMKNFVTPPIEDSFWINSINLLVFCFEFPIIGFLSDCFGCRKRVMTFGAIAFATLGPTSIVILGRYHSNNNSDIIGSSNGSGSSSIVNNSNNVVDLLWIPFCCQLVLTTSLACYGAPMCAWLVESFEPKLRSTSVCIGYNIAQAIAGSISPILATTLVQNVGLGAPGILLFALSILSMIGLWCIAPQHSHHNNNMERTVVLHGSFRTCGTIVEPKEIC